MVTLVLLPGMDGTGEMFQPLLAALGAEVDVKVVRYPVAEVLSYAELEIVARSALPAAGPFVLLGESFSGPIAVAVAASAPSELRGLILCASFIRNPRPLISSLRGVISLAPIALAPRGPLVRLLFGRFATESRKYAFNQALSRVSPAVLRSRLQAVLSVDVTTKFAASKVPTLYLRAAHDRLVPRSASELIGSLRSDSQIVELDAPHMVLQATPAPAAKVIRTFLREVQIAR